MCEIKVGIIAEGSTDQEIIRGIINAEFPDRSFVISNISPTEDELLSGIKLEGFGWGGVYKVCKHLNEKLDLLKAAGVAFDVLVIHLDGDVMFLSYDSAKLDPDSNDKGLPCYVKTESIENNCGRLREVLLSWDIGDDSGIVYCIPYINTDAWAGYILYENYRDYISEGLTKEELDTFLLQHGKKKKRLIRMHGGQIKKDRSVYKTVSDMISLELLRKMRERFGQLNLFCEELSKLICREMEVIL